MLQQQQWQRQKKAPEKDALLDAKNCVNTYKKIMRQKIIQN